MNTILVGTIVVFAYLMIVLLFLIGLCIAARIAEDTISHRRQADPRPGYLPAPRTHAPGRATGHTPRPRSATGTQGKRGGRHA